MFFKSHNLRGFFLNSRDHEDYITMILNYKGYKPTYGYCTSNRKSGLLYIDIFHKEYYIGDDFYKQRPNTKISFKEFLALI